MLDPSLLRSQIAATAERLARRGYALDTEALESLEAERKAIQVRTQELQNLRNTHSKQIGMLMGSIARHIAADEHDVADFNRAQAEKLKAEVAGFGDELKTSEARLEEIRGRLDAPTPGIPNLPA